MDITVLRSFSQEFQKVATDLTPEARAKLPKKDFAVGPKKSNTGEEAYPLPDRQHARSALGLARMHGDQSDLTAVRAKIKAKFPDMLKSAAGFMSSLANGAAGHKAELAGLGILAAPSLDEAQAHVRAGLAHDYNKAGVEKRTVLPHAAKPLSEIAGLGVLAGPAYAALKAHQ